MVKIKMTEGDGVISLELDGHAGQAKEGEDIVCSACSILVYTVAQIVKLEDHNRKMKSPPTVVLESGKAVISCEPVDEIYNEIFHAFYVAEVGYLLLARNYPQFVELEMFG